MVREKRGIGRGKMIIKMIIRVIQGAIKGLRGAQERKVIKMIKMITGERSLIILADVDRRCRRTRWLCGWVRAPCCRAGRMG